MSLLIQKVFVAGILAIGLMMLVRGGRRLARSEPSSLAIGSEPMPRLCPPTAGEIAEEFGVGLALRKLGCLAIAGCGIVVTCGSLLSLLKRKGEI
jgi:hypothetical protein